MLLLPPLLLLLLSAAVELVVATAVDEAAGADDAMVQFCVQLRAVWIHSLATFTSKFVCCVPVDVSYTLLVVLLTSYHCSARLVYTKPTQQQQQTLSQCTRRAFGC